MFRIAEALLRIRALAAAMTAPQPLEAFWPEVPAQKPKGPVIVRSAVASTFVAALELCRESVVGLDQDEDFSAIMVSPRGIDTLYGICASMEQGEGRTSSSRRTLNELPIGSIVSCQDVAVEFLAQTERKSLPRGIASAGSS